MSKAFALLLAAAIGFSAAWYVQGLRWDADVLEKKNDYKLALGEARTDEQTKCKARQKITKEISSAYHHKSEAIAARADAAYRGLRADPGKQCVQVSVAGAAGGNHAAGSGGKPAGPVAVPAEPLIGIAVAADQCAARLTACQDFIRRTWEDNGQ